MSWEPAQGAVLDLSYVITEAGFYLQNTVSNREHQLGNKKKQTSGFQ